MNKQPGSTLPTAINVSRSSYIIAFLSVETILARTIHICNNISNWFRTLFKNVNHSRKRQEKFFFHLQKEYCAPGTQTLITASAERLKSLFEQAKFTRTLMSPLRLIVLISYPQSGVNVLHIVNTLSYFTLVRNVISILVDMVNFAMVKVDNFCKNKLIAMQFKLFDGRYARSVVSKSERSTKLPFWMFNDNVIVMS